MEPHLSDDISDDLLERYLANDVSAAERRAVERILRQRPSAWRMIALLRRAWFVGRDARTEGPDDARVRQLIAERLGVFPGETSVATRPATRARAWLSRRSIDRRDTSGAGADITVPPSAVFLRRSAYIAAGLVLAAGVVWYVKPDAQTVSATTRRYTTGTGQRATVELADGSRITLAPKTRLTIGSDANGRSVSLVGEAHFDIVSSARAPFVVHTGSVTTRVLGTTFEVRRYADDRLGRVLVFSGKVATRGRGAPVTLTAGMMGEFTDSSIVTRSATDAATYTDWTNGQLVFRKVPVPAALATLTRWYGYQFRLGDSTLAADSVTAVFTIGETGEMMRRLQHLLSVSMTFDDSVVMLRPARDGAAGRVPPRNPKPLPFSPTTEVGR